ncbi:MAG TPA: Crp/Fnr family transcriptional regulator [Acidimicrobiales bacterium]
MQGDQGPVAAANSWSRHETDAFMAGAGERRYKKGAAIIRQGEPTAVHLIVRGWVKVTSTRLSGHELVILLRGPGELLGHYEAVQGPAWPAAASIVALEPTTTMSVTADRFIEFLLAHPAVCLAELRTLVTEAVSISRQRVDSALVGSGQRLAAMLVDLAVRHGRETNDGIEIAIALSQDDIAGLIGASRDSVIRALASMRSRDLVETGRRSITVRDLDALRADAANERAVG